MCKFRYDPTFRETVVIPFTEGRYSELDKKYVEMYFPKIHFGEDGPSRPLNRRVIDRDPLLRKWWRTKYEIEIPEEAEVWSKPEKAHEIFGLEIPMEELYSSVDELEALI